MDRKNISIELFQIIDILQVREQFHLQDAELVDFSVGCFGEVMLLFSSCPPKRIVTNAGSFVDTQAHTHYYAVVVFVDWLNAEFLTMTSYDLGIQDFNYHFLRSLGEDFLLLGSRCFYNQGEPEHNAMRIGKDGVVKHTWCMGDGIENCIVKADGTMITSYFDEGVFGNFGWEVPIGSSGLIAWNSNGEIIWQNKKYPIYDCYAMSLDAKEQIWFYYYADFHLVKMDVQKDEVFTVPLSGSSKFAVAPTQEAFFFQGGYGEEDKFYYLIRKGESLEQRGEIAFFIGGKKAAIAGCSMLRYQMLFLTEDGILCGYELGYN